MAEPRKNGGLLSGSSGPPANINVPTPIDDTLAFAYTDSVIVASNCILTVNAGSDSFLFFMDTIRVGAHGICQQECNGKQHYLILWFSHIHMV